MLKYANQTHYIHYSTQSSVFLQVERIGGKTGAALVRQG